MLRTSRLFFGASIVAAAAAVSLVLAFGGVLTASGASSGGKVIVPSPPGQPTLAPTITTKTTTRIYGENPYEVAVSVTQHIWPAVLPGSAQSVPDRPRAVTLLTPDDPLTAITATPIVHFPDDAPPLYVTRSGIPDVVLAEIKRLGPVGIDRFNNVQAFLFGGGRQRGCQEPAHGDRYQVVRGGGTDHPGAGQQGRRALRLDPQPRHRRCADGQWRHDRHDRFAGRISVRHPRHALGHAHADRPAVGEKELGAAGDHHCARAAFRGRDDLPVRRAEPDLVVGGAPTRQVRECPADHERRCRRLQLTAAGHSSGDRDRV